MTPQDLMHRLTALFPDFADLLAALGSLVSDCMASVDEELANAAATGFLEGSQFDADFVLHLRGEALRYYSQWDR